MGDMMSRMLQDDVQSVSNVFKQLREAVTARAWSDLPYNEVFWQLLESLKSDPHALSELKASVLTLVNEGARTSAWILDILVPQMPREKRHAVIAVLQLPIVKRVLESEQFWQLVMDRRFLTCCIQCAGVRDLMRILGDRRLADLMLQIGPSSAVCIEMILMDAARLGTILQMRDKQGGPVFRSRPLIAVCELLQQPGVRAVLRCPQIVQLVFNASFPPMVTVLLDSYEADWKLARSPTLSPMERVQCTVELASRVAHQPQVETILSAIAQHSECIGELLQVINTHLLQPLFELLDPNVRAQAEAEAHAKAYEQQQQQQQQQQPQPQTQYRPSSYTSRRQSTSRRPRRDNNPSTESEVPLPPPPPLPPLVRKFPPTLGIILAFLHHWINVVPDHRKQLIPDTDTVAPTPHVGPSPSPSLATPAPSTTSFHDSSQAPSLGVYLLDIRLYRMTLIAILQAIDQQQRASSHSSRRSRSHMSSHGSDTRHIVEILFADSTLGFVVKSLRNLFPLFGECLLVAITRTTPLWRVDQTPLPGMLRSLAADDTSAHSAPITDSDSKQTSPMYTQFLHTPTQPTATIQYLSTGSVAIADMHPELSTFLSNLPDVPDQSLFATYIELVRLVCQRIANGSFAVGQLLLDVHVVAVLWDLAFSFLRRSSETQKAARESASKRRDAAQAPLSPPEDDDTADVYTKFSSPQAPEQDDSEDVWQRMDSLGRTAHVCFRVLQLLQSSSFTLLLSRCTEAWTMILLNDAFWLALFKQQTVVAAKTPRELLEVFYDDARLPSLLFHLHRHFASLFDDINVNHILDLVCMYNPLYNNDSELEQPMDNPQHVLWKLLQLVSVNPELLKQALGLLECCVRPATLQMFKEILELQRWRATYSPDDANSRGELVGRIVSLSQRVQLSGIVDAMYAHPAATVFGLSTYVVRSLPPNMRVPKQNSDADVDEAIRPASVQSDSALQLKQALGNFFIVCARRTTDIGLLDTHEMRMLTKDFLELSLKAVTRNCTVRAKKMASTLQRAGHIAPSARFLVMRQLHRMGRRVVWHKRSTAVADFFELILMHDSMRTALHAKSFWALIQSRTFLLTWIEYAHLSEQRRQVTAATTTNTTSTTTTTNTNTNTNTTSSTQPRVREIWNRTKTKVAYSTQQLRKLGELVRNAEFKAFQKRLGHTRFRRFAADIAAFSRTDKGRLLLDELVRARAIKYSRTASDSVQQNQIPDIPAVVQTIQQFYRSFDAVSSAASRVTQLARSGVHRATVGSVRNAARRLSSRLRSKL
jgi:hypothetical protein